MTACLRVCLRNAWFLLTMSALLAVHSSDALAADACRAKCDNPYNNCQSKAVMITKAHPAAVAKKETTQCYFQWRACLRECSPKYN